MKIALSHLAFAGLFIFSATSASAQIKINLKLSYPQAAAPYPLIGFRLNNKSEVTSQQFIVHGLSIKQSLLGNATDA